MPIQKELDDIALSLMRRRWSKDKALKFIYRAPAMLKKV
jgi:hypothetical protein